MLVIIVYGLRWKKAHKIGGGWGIPVRRAIGIEKGGDCYSLFLLLLMSTKHRKPNNLLHMIFTQKFSGLKSGGSSLKKWPSVDSLFAFRINGGK